MDTGMPQGCILGTKGYLSYVSPLFEIVRKHSFNVHMYADDTQLYLGFNLWEYEAAKLQMEGCIADIRSWLSANCLKLNDDKTELLIIGQKHSLSKLPTASLNIRRTWLWNGPVSRPVRLNKRADKNCPGQGKNVRDWSRSMPAA